ncbi:hypothetical protein GCM10023089_30790 [Quisquiliibacterium transsilvanicum]
MRINQATRELRAVAARRDKERKEQEAFERLRTELSQAYAAPESSYKPLTAAEAIARNRA